jgi:murein DD-endopeptidase MepM/ murein hydrolase activator NlpD
MPLLREQRRASRFKHAALGAGAFLVLGGGATTWIAMAMGPPDSGSAPVADAPPAPTVTPAVAEAASFDAGLEAPDPVLGERPIDDLTPTSIGAVVRTLHDFGNAPGFRPALMQAGTTADEYAELEAALEDVMDFRRCRPQDRLVFERDGDGTILLFEYHGGSATEYYQATRDERGELRGGRVEIPVERRRLAVGGTVRTSLGDAVVGAGLGRGVVGAILAAFEGKANFSSDTRTGDTFRVVLDEERIDGELLRYGTIHAVEYRGQHTGHLRAFHFASRPSERGEYYDEEGRELQGGWLRTPVRYDRISSPFDPQRMHPILRRVRPHNGVDYAAGTGTPVRAAAEGTITFAGVKGANGNLVSIRHANGHETFYAHLSRIERGMSPGTRVEQLQLIGAVGSTGRSTGPHLHFGLKRNGRFIDPLEQINGPGRILPASALERFRPRMQALQRELDAIDVDALPRSASPAPVVLDAEDVRGPTDPMD